MTAKEFYNSVKENKTLEEIMIEFTRIKCLEAIRNTRNKACEIIIEYASKGHPLTLTSISRDIMNIPHQNVMPNL